MARPENGSPEPKCDLAEQGVEAARSTGCSPWLSCPPSPVFIRHCLQSSSYSRLQRASLPCAALCDAICHAATGAPPAYEELLLSSLTILHGETPTILLHRETPITGKQSAAWLLEARVLPAGCCQGVACSRSCFAAAAPVWHPLPWLPRQLQLHLPFPRQ